ncbi:MAG TPA: hypothetical protein VD930_11665 [Gemmatimonadales bacterium]|nr:hypothetical protein [Gemmatimonadales bacterium]
MADQYSLAGANGSAEDERGGFVALAVIAAAVGAGAALLLAPEAGAKTRSRVGRGLRDIRRARRSSRREGRLMGLAGLFIGAGLAALLNPESGPATRQRVGSTWSRVKVGAVDRINRIRNREEPAESESRPDSVRTVQELGRDPNSVF